jgi:hypothetical protein
MVTPYDAPADVSPMCSSDQLASAMAIRPGRGEHRQRPVTPGPFGNNDIADLGPANAWAAGQGKDARPLAEHWNGTAWSVMPGPTGSDPTPK